MFYHFAVEIDLPKERVFVFFSDLERWFRLNPQWSIISMEAPTLEPGSSFALSVEYERSEKRADYRVVVAEFDQAGEMKLKFEGEEPREITVSVAGTRTGSVLRYREQRESGLTGFSPHEQRELELWLKSVADYIRVSNRTSPFSRLWKWFLDRYWLKMSPSGRRTAFFVVVAEGLSLVFFLLLLVWLLIFKRV